MTLVGIAVLASIGIPLWFSQPRISLQSAAELLVQDMRTVRDRSIDSYMPCRIDFDTDGGGYAAFDNSGNALEAPMGNGNYLRDYDSDAVFRGIKIERASFGGTSTLKFDRSGSESAPGFVTLSYGGETRKIRFDLGEPYIVLPGEQ